jgi:hypothetical protein
MTAIAMLFTECKKTASFENYISIADPDDREEVAFEDVATDISIVPLISDEPIGGCNKVKCYGSIVLVRADQDQSLFIFEDGKQIAHLCKVGRGRGEYTRIGDFVYSPKNNILYIKGSAGINTVLVYSFPDLQFLRSFDGGDFTAFAEHDDSTLICRMTNEEDQKFADYFVSAKNGEKLAIAKEVGITSLMFNTDMNYYTPQHRILLETGSVNTISEVPARIGDKERIIRQFDFGDNSVPVRFDSINYQDDPEPLLSDFINYIITNRDVVLNINQAVADKGSVSFWYKSICSPQDVTYCRINDNDEMVRYCGFKASGTKTGLFATGVTEKGQYVTLVEGLPETLFDESDERSEFSAKLENTMKAQAFNNPVLVFYNIK